MQFFNKTNGRIWLIFDIIKPPFDAEVASIWPILKARLEILQKILFAFLGELKPTKFPSEINWPLFKKNVSTIALNLKLPFFLGLNHFRECLGYTYNETSVPGKIICNSLKIGMNRDWICHLVFWHRPFCPEFMIRKWRDRSDCIQITWIWIAEGLESTIIHWEMLQSNAL